jgi:hypothetical protein
LSVSIAARDILSHLPQGSCQLTNIFCDDGRACQRDIKQKVEGQFGSAPACEEQWIVRKPGTGQRKAGRTPRTDAGKAA